MTADDGDVHVVHVQALGLRDEGVGAHDVQGGHAEHLLGVVRALLLEHLRGDGHGGVHRVRNDVHERAGAVLGDGDAQVAHDAGVDGEQVVAGHARLAGDAGRDHDEVAAGERGGGFSAPS